MAGMFIKTTISELSCNKPWFSLDTDADEYIFNVRYLSTIVEYNGGSRFFLINDYDRHGGDVRFTAPITVAEIIAEFDNPYALDYLNVDYCKNDNPAKGLLNKDIPTDHIILLYPYHNPAYTWLIFDSYNKLRKILIVGTLDDLYDDLSGASATTTLAGTTTVVAATTGVVTTASPTTTPVATTTPAPTTTPTPTTTPAPTTTFHTTTSTPTTTTLPDNILLNDDDTPILNEDGSYIYTS